MILSLFEHAVEFYFSHCEAVVGKDRFDAIVSQINAARRVAIFILAVADSVYMN